MQEFLGSKSLELTFLNGKYFQIYAFATTFLDLKKNILRF